MSLLISPCGHCQSGGSNQTNEVKGEKLWEEKWTQLDALCLVYFYFPATTLAAAMAAGILFSSLSVHSTVQYEKYQQGLGAAGVGGGGSSNLVQIFIFT